MAPLSGDAQRFAQLAGQGGRGPEFGATRAPLAEVIRDREAGAARPAVERAQGLDAGRIAFILAQNGQRSRLREWIEPGHFDLAAVARDPRGGSLRNSGMATRS